MSIATEPSRIIGRPIQAGESLSSWLVRIARDNAFSLHELVTRLIGRSIHHDSIRDLDVELSTRLATALVDRGLATIEELQKRELKPQLETMSGFSRGRRTTKWLLATTLSGRQLAPPHCPSCLADDAIPFYRADWRFSWAVTCTLHKVSLIERCAVCAKPNDLRRSMRSVRWANLALSTCVHCFADQRLKRPSIAKEKLLAWQLGIEDARREGWARVGVKRVITPAYLQGLAVLLRMLRLTRAGTHLRWILSAEESYGVLERPFDRLDLESRAALIQAAVSLVENWPSQFLTLGRRAGMRSTDLRDLGLELPYWLEVETRAFDRTWYQPAPAEERCAAAFLSKRAGIAARSIAREWLGAATSKPSLRSQLRSLDAPIQLPLPTIPLESSDARLKQSLVERLCKTLLRRVSRQSYSLRFARRAPQESFLLT